MRRINKLLFNDINVMVTTLSRFKSKHGKHLPDGFREQAMGILDTLADITIKQGHSEQLDELKERTWHLMNL